MALGVDRTEWAAHLRSVAGPVVAGTPIASGHADAGAWVRAFEDERGVRRRVDQALLGALVGVDAGGPPPGATPDEAIWWDTGEDPVARVRAGDGALVFDRIADAGSIEVATEAELCALHGLWRHRRHAGVVDRCLDAAAWHVAELDPSNATGLPWAVHVFVELARRDPACGALFHAEGLVHGCCVSLGRPGIRAACLLLDAARELELAAGDPALR